MFTIEVYKQLLETSEKLKELLLSKELPIESGWSMNVLGKSLKYGELNIYIARDNDAIVSSSFNYLNNKKIDTISTSYYSNNVGLPINVTDLDILNYIDSVDTYITNAPLFFKNIQYNTFNGIRYTKLCNTNISGNNFGFEYSSIRIKKGEHLNVSVLDYNEGMWDKTTEIQWVEEFKKSKQYSELNELS